MNLPGELHSARWHSLFKYSSTQLGVQFTSVMPAKAGIQTFFLDSRLKHAGMTIGDNGHLIPWRRTKHPLLWIVSRGPPEKVCVPLLDEVMKEAVKSLMMCLLLTLLLIVPTPSVAAEENVDFPTTPVDHQGKKWRIGYLEGGNYPDYQVILKSTVRGLINLGWIQKMEIPDRYEPNHEEYWKTLAKNIKSDYIEFVPEAFFSSKFDKSLRAPHGPDESASGALRTTPYGLLHGRARMR